MAKQTEAKQETALLAAVESATSFDLEEVRARIDELRNKLDALIAVEKVIDIRLNGRPQRAPAAKTARGKTELAQRIFDDIAKNGPGTPTTIAKRTGLESTGERMILVKPSFEILSDLNGDRILRSIEAAGRTCYKSEDRITDTSAVRFCQSILTKRHESVIEHESMTVKFLIDRGVSHELVRHRLCSFSQESTRYCNYGKGEHCTFVIPPWCSGVHAGTYSRLYVLHNWEEYINGEATTARWLLSLAQAEDAYLSLLAEGWQPQQARAVLPNSLKTEIVVTANLREWRHIFRLRTDKAAHPQIRQVMEPLLTQVRAAVPVLFDDLGA